MALASIQFNAATPGQSVLGLSDSATVTLTDAGGAGATSYQWEILSAPAPCTTLPSITSPTAQIATIPAPVGNFVDGLYVVRLTRVDGFDGTTVDTKFFGIADVDGYHLPTAGVNRNMSNVGGSVNAQIAGWMGSVLGGSNTLLDAFLRNLRAKLSYDGLVDTSGTHPYNVNWQSRNRRHIILKATGATKTVNLPAASAHNKITVVDGVGDAGLFPITIVPNGIETILGLPSWQITANYSALTFYADPGVGWILI